MAAALHDRVRGCLVGVALGDALGMPWETCSHEEIQEMTSGAGVTGLQDLPAGHPRKLNDTRAIALGETTDDWQLTRAVAASLIRCGGFHVFDQAAAHVEAYETSTKGWGGGTRAALAELKRWFDTRGREGRRPDLPATPGPRRGKGNGVLMKLAPLACFAALSKTEAGAPDVRAMVASLGRMSHLEEVSPDVGAVLHWILETHRSPGPDELLALLRDDGLASTLRRLFHGERGPSPDDIRAACGTAFLASESAAFCLATLLRRPDDFRGAVLEAINAGGDTDTNASIVGALVGARVGLSGIDRSWMAAVPAASEALGTADRLIGAAARRP